jgi:hypothetical protein
MGASFVAVRGCQHGTQGDLMRGGGASESSKFLFNFPESFPDTAPKLNIPSINARLFGLVKLNQVSFEQTTSFS